MNWFIEKEKITPFGNVDLVISCPDLRYLVVIENKIWAAEKTDQLGRYARWMETQKDFYTDRALIYLTPDGKPSDTDCGCKYLRLSYNQDISYWLTSIIGEIRAPRVKEAVIQYREVTQDL